MTKQQVKNEVADVKYELNNIKQLRVLNRQERVIERHLNAPINDESKIAMCKRFWNL